MKNTPNCTPSELTVEAQASVDRIAAHDEIVDFRVVGPLQFTQAEGQQGPDLLSAEMRSVLALLNFC
jgi:hypothetical protein